MITSTQMHRKGRCLCQINMIPRLPIPQTKQTDFEVVHPPNAPGLLCIASSKPRGTPTRLGITLQGLRLDRGRARLAVLQAHALLCLAAPGTWLLGT